MGTTIISALVGLICTSVASVVTFLLTRRKYNTEVDTQQIENMNKSFDVYKKVMDESIAVQDRKIIMQDNKIKQLQQENDALRREISNLQIQMAQLLGTACYDTSCRLRKSVMITAKQTQNGNNA